MTAESPEPVDRSTWSRLAVVTGLLGLAVTQPVLDLFGRNPTFFTAGPYTRWQIVQLAVLVTAGPALVIAFGLGLVTRLDARVGRWVYAVTLLALGCLTGNVVLRGVGLDGSGMAIAASVVGAGSAWLVDRSRVGRMFLQYLALGNVLFLVSFLVLSPTADLLSDGGDQDLGTAVVPAPLGPVVVLVLDELPVTTLMRPDGTVNRERYPGFAELADRSVWYRNASSHQSTTHLAVPSILTGQLAEDGQLPSVQDHPRNLFTLFGGELPIDSYEPVTSLCPRAFCDPAPPPPLEQAVRDAAVVYAHRVLPPRLRSALPDINASWGGFGDDLGDGAVASIPSGVLDESYRKYVVLDRAEKSPPGQAAILAERIAAIGPEPALHAIHVVFPHFPWVLSRDGTVLLGPPASLQDVDEPPNDWVALQQYQLHSMQVGAADVAIGNLLHRLDELGAWDDTTLVVVADHGTSLLPPDFGRAPTADNVQELLRVPLFVHGPDLAEGTVVDEPAQTIDVLPTLVDLLGIEVDWEMDGTTLLDRMPGPVAPLVGRDLAPALDVVRRHAVDFPRGDGWTALAAVGVHADLVGRPLADLELGTASDLAWTPDHEDEIRDLPTAKGEAPQLLRGLVETPDGARPPEVLVVVNGTAAGVAGGYIEAGDGWRFSAFLAPYFVDGPNEFAAYEVTAGADGRVLHRLG